MENRRSVHGHYDYRLPPVVSDLIEGSQWTNQSASTISGLLAAVAAVLLGVFKADQSLPRGTSRDFLLAADYLSIALNINAAVASVALLDDLSGVGVTAAERRARLESLSTIRLDIRSPSSILRKFGASKLRRPAIFLWVALFYSGVICLAVTVLTYIALTEPLVTAIVVGLIFGLTLLPVSFFMFFRGVGDSDNLDRGRESGISSQTAKM